MKSLYQSSQQDFEVTESHEINVTPFIDVMLVLLIIFMVAAPLATASLPVDLPSATAHAQPNPEQPVFLTVQSDMTLAVNDETPFALSALSTQLPVQIPNHDTRIFLRADKQLTYDELMQVIHILGAEGYLKIALVGLDQPGE